MKSKAKVTVAVSAVAVAGLVALAVPFLLPHLPAPVQIAVGGTIQTVPGTVDELFAETGLDQDSRSRSITVSHADVDEEYVTAASIWPWELPPGWGFPRNRGVPDTPGRHWNGMGVKAAFSTWASASLDAVQGGGVEPDAARRLLDDLEDAYRTLFDAGLLTDRSFIAKSVDPLRP